MLNLERSLGWEIREATKSLRHQEKEYFHKIKAYEEGSHNREVELTETQRQKMKDWDEDSQVYAEIDRQRDDVNVTEADLIAVPEGKITEAGLRANISVGIQYVEAWIGGNGCVPLYNLMEDAATAEISRTQVWQWVHNPKGVLDDGRKVTIELVRALIAEELEKIKAEVGEARFALGQGMAQKVFVD